MDDGLFVVVLDDDAFDRLDEAPSRRRHMDSHPRPVPITVPRLRCSRSLPFPRQGRGPPAIHAIHASHDVMDITLLMVSPASTITGLHAQP